jgi:hypothetical protein
MTVANGFRFDWGKVESWENGSMIPTTTPQFYLNTEAEQNEDTSNGVGNNKFKIPLPFIVKFGAKIENSSGTNEKIEEDKELLKAKMIRIQRRSGSSRRRNSRP